MQEFDDVLLKDENKQVNNQPKENENEEIIEDKNNILVEKPQENLIEDDKLDKKSKNNLENLDDELINNQEKKKLIVASNNAIPNVDNKVEKKKDQIEEKLDQVSNSSGLNLKAYFVEDNKKEIDQISKGNLGYTNFTFTGNMKDFYSKVYKHVLESNLIARQLADEKDRDKYPTFKDVSEKFEEFMKATGQELVKRGHLEKYEPFGGLSANELKAIENSCLLNRPTSEREALRRSVSNIKGRNFDEIVEKGYQRATETIGVSHKKGDNPEKDKAYLQSAANQIKGMAVLRNSEKIWNAYIPDFSAPKWNQPIHKHVISNAFKAVRRGLGIAFDCAFKFPINNAIRGVRYPFVKLASTISIAYNQRNLQNMVYAKGFTKQELANAMNSNEKVPLDVEKDVKAIESNYKNNEKVIEDYKKEQVKEVEVVNNNDDKPVKEEIKNENPHKQEIIIDELAEKIPNQDEMVPEIKDNVNVLNKQQEKVNN